VARRSRRGDRRARPGVLVACALALVATAGIRVAGGGDEATPDGGTIVDVATTVAADGRPEGVDAGAVPERNPFGTPGGPATAPDPSDVPSSGDTVDPSSVDTVDATDVAARVAPGG
jgi:hypothetical protein